MFEQRKNIAGISFRGQALAGQNFRNSTAGLKPIQKILSGLLSGIVTIASGILPILSGSILELNSLANESSLPVIVGLFIYLACLAVIVIRGFHLAFISFALGTLILTTIGFVVLNINSLDFIIITILSIILGCLGILVASSLLILHTSVVGTKRGLIAFTGLIVFAVATIPFAISGPIRSSVSGGSVTTIAALFTILAIATVVQQSLRNTSKFSWIHKRALFWAAIGGTSFYGADLTDVCLDGADLSHTDFRKANLNRTQFKHTRGLQLARLEGTILEDARVRELIVTGNGWGQDFTDADLCGANLQKADLREAILVRAQLLDADLSGAKLTDACIQDWNINHNTRFAGVECQRVYLKCSSSRHFLEPKPDSGEFLPGEFEKWVTEIRDTIDLIFQNGLNWRAFAFSLTQTAIDHQGLDLSVRSIENKGDGVVVTKVGISLETNKTAIHQEMTGHYQGAVAAIESGYQLALRAKDEEIDRLTNFYETQQKFIQGLVTGIAETKGQVLIQGEGNRVYLMNQAGDIMENSNQNLNAGGNIDRSSDSRIHIGGDVTGSSVSLGELSGQVSTAIQQIQETSDEGEDSA